METKTDLAIVLKTVTFEERHRIVTGLTAEHGRISCVARNSIQSRRFGGSLEPFSAAQWQWVEKEGSDLGRLDSAEIKRSYEGLRKSFEKLAMASSLSEILLRVAPEHEPCPDLFRLHSNALALVEEGSDPAPGAPPDLKLLNFYLGKLLQWSGNQPQILRCLSCETPLENVPCESALTWSIAEAAWRCHSCRGSESAHVRRREGVAFQHTLIRVMPTAIRDLVFALENPIRKAMESAHAGKEEHRGLFTLMEALMLYHIPGFDQTPLKSLRFVREPTLLEPGSHPTFGPA